MCPYMSEERKLNVKAAKKLVGTESNQTSMFCTVPRYVDENPELREPTSPVWYAKAEDVPTEQYDPLLFSLENVELITEQMPEMSLELDMAPVLPQNPKKLPVRRHVKLESDSEGFSAYPSLGDPQNLGSPQAEYDFPMDDELADFQGGSNEDMEFEPQTYFSFTELLATGDDRMDELCDGVKDEPFDDGSMDDVLGCWGNSSGYDIDVDQAMSSRHNSLNSSGCDMDVYRDISCKTEMDMVNSLQAEPNTDPVPCGMCRQIQPATDLSCEICGLQIHSHCSPWEELSSSHHRWRCGSCRDWR